MARGGSQWPAERNKSSLPKGRGGIYGGTTDPQPGDEMVGGWSRQQREAMDQRFAEAMARALHGGQTESSFSASRSSATAASSTAIGTLEPRRR